MDWVQAGIDLVKWLGTFTVATGGLVWVAKKVIERLLEAGVQQHRAKLEHESTVELERLRSTLAVIAHKDQTQSALLVARQAEAIARMYELLVEAEEQCSLAMSMVRWGDEPTSAERAPAANKSIRDMLAYFRRNRIYFSESAVQSIEEMTRHFTQAWKSFVVFGIETQADGLQRERFDEHQKAWTIISETVPAARARLETQFRQLLGV